MAPDLENNLQNYLKSSQPSQNSEISHSLSMSMKSKDISPRASQFINKSMIRQQKIYQAPAGKNLRNSQNVKENNMSKLKGIINESQSYIQKEQSHLDNKQQTKNMQYLQTNKRNSKEKISIAPSISSNQSAKDFSVYVNNFTPAKEKKIDSVIYQKNISEKQLARKKEKMKTETKAKPVLIQKSLRIPQKSSQPKNDTSLQSQKKYKSNPKQLLNINKSQTLNLEIKLDNNQNLISKKNQLIAKPASPEKVINNPQKGSVKYLHSLIKIKNMINNHEQFKENISKDINLIINALIKQLQQNLDKEEIILELLKQLMNLPIEYKFIQPQTIMKLFDLYHLNLSFPFYLDDIFELIPVKINRLIVLKAIVEKMGIEKAPYQQIIIKLASLIIKVSTQEEIRPFIDHLIDIFKIAINDTIPDVRKAVVFCIVEMHFIFKQEIDPYIQMFHPNQQKLIQIFIKRKQEQK